MNLEKYGIKLVGLTHDKIELVRQWRNHPRIKSCMEYREEITSEMQESWFSRIDNSGKDFYFLINFDGLDVGLIDIRDVDFERKEGEAGIFIWDKESLNSDIPFRASLCLLDWAFEDLKLDRTIAHILSDNKRSIQFAKIRGYQLVEGQENDYKQLYVLEKENYFASRRKILKIFR